MFRLRCLEAGTRKSLSRNNAGAETPRREANAPPQKPFRALPGPPPDGRRAMGENALTGAARLCQCAWRGQSLAQSDN
eukprot:6781125-Alexandrium_andersonii.AAC.1